MRVVNSDVPTVTRFASSQASYEQFDRAMRRTILSNLHGIPTDTPYFEKNGWTGDAQVGAPTMLATLGLARFFTKRLGDIRDSQADSGQLPVIVPSSGWGFTDLSRQPNGRRCIRSCCARCIAGTATSGCCVSTGSR